MTVITQTLSSGNILVVNPMIDFGETIIIGVFLLILAISSLNIVLEMVQQEDV